MKRNYISSPPEFLFPFNRQEIVFLGGFGAYSLGVYL